ncbi:hypothetical protein QR680_000419 [Steinernema hermaphroditum]|uniref:Uncharacterized protein n=1 Tax=Steinernema hermaphroditum TaxID=289476 RepID=A0AA39GUI6_9BILA|nr:hypothetical protein QR680_000419 [Steinernema hermaphroditum]
MRSPTPDALADARCARRRPTRSPTPDALPDALADARCARRRPMRSPTPDAISTLFNYFRRRSYQLLSNLFVSVTAACAIANIVKSSLGLNKMLVDDARCARRRPMRSPTPDALPDARRVRRCRTRSPMPDAFADAGRLFLLLLGVLASRGLRRSDVLLFIR